MKAFSINKLNKKIKVEIVNDLIFVKGPYGSIHYKFHIIQENKKIFIKKSNINFFIKKVKSLFYSVSNGWFLELNLNGIGYKSFKINDKIALDLGYSNLILYKPTNLLKIKNLKNKIILFSIDKDYLYNVAISLRKYAIPDLYKGKGLLFNNETIKLKKKTKT